MSMIHSRLPHQPISPAYLRALDGDLNAKPGEKEDNGLLDANTHSSPMEPVDTYEPSIDLDELGDLSQAKANDDGFWKPVIPLNHLSQSAAGDDGFWKPVIPLNHNGNGRPKIG